MKRKTAQAPAVAASAAARLAQREEEKGWSRAHAPESTRGSCPPGVLEA
jgi:hypothetical protein